ncbi:hypothetical protein SAMN05444156_0938 [Verrucomicrobium sp. GAS474]|nr:hypothetical protein SAMN05444156_0938 [Verrucomicrobium sp. GAS474]
MVEIMMSLGVLAFAILMLIALIPLGLRTNSDTRQESTSVNIIGTMIADWKAVGLTTNQTPVFKLPALSPGKVVSDVLWVGADGAIANKADSRYRVAYRVTPPSSSSSFAPYYVAVTVSWPAQAATPNGKVEATAALPSR